MMVYHLYFQIYIYLFIELLYYSFIQLIMQLFVIYLYYYLFYLIMYSQIYFLDPISTVHLLLEHQPLSFLPLLLHIPTLIPLPNFHKIKMLIPLSLKTNTKVFWKNWYVIFHFMIVIFDIIPSMFLFILFYIIF